MRTKYQGMKNGLAIAVSLVVVAAASLGTTEIVMAKEGTPFQAGFDHGCSDANVAFSARYQSTQ